MSKNYMEGARVALDPTRAAALVGKCLLVMSNHSSDRDDDTVDDFTTLDEYDGSGYTAGHGGAGRKTVTLSAVRDDANEKVNLQASGTVTWTTLGATPGTRSITGVLVIWQGTSDDTDAYPVRLYDMGPSVPGGADLEITFTNNNLIEVTIGT